MIVIADTTPLNYLILIDLTHLLPQLFGEVVIPQAVLSELQDPRAPAKVREWLVDWPEWLAVREVQQPDPTLVHLDPGEREAITLAQELQADLLLLDEHQGRQEAIKRGFNVTGMIGLLDQAGTRRMLDVPMAVTQLRQTTFRVAPRLLNALLDRHKS